MGRGRGRGKGKKQSVIAETRNEGDENLPLKRRVGRPEKPLKDEIESENEYEMLKEEDGGGKDTKIWVSSESSKNQICMDSGRKRKRASQLKEDADSVKEENGVVTKTNATVSIKTSVGYRQIGSRRKSTPRRAAEVVLSANEDFIDSSCFLYYSETIFQIQ